MNILSEVELQILAQKLIVGINKSIADFSSRKFTAHHFEYVKDSLLNSLYCTKARFYVMHNLTKNVVYTTLIASIDDLINKISNL